MSTKGTLIICSSFNKFAVLIILIKWLASKEWQILGIIACTCFSYIICLSIRSFTIETLFLIERL
jgi:ABC-type proline/glycine betaine transport system permease subunit